MGRQQGKSTLNSIKSKTTPPETGGSTTARPEHAKRDETKKYLENNFMKMFEALKNEMKKSLKK